MPTTPEGFRDRLSVLKADLAGQGRRVQGQIESAFEALFERSRAKAEQVIAQDDAIDRADVEVERGAVALLADATRAGAALEPAQLRAVLTAVKVNNELERMADLAASIAEHVPAFASARDIPETFRVMTNSVVGIVRDVTSAYARDDGALAKVVLQSEDAVLAFKAAILRDAERQITAGSMPADFAFLLHEIAGCCERIADHATNIAEQIIYQTTGAIVRHLPTGWVELPKV